jgi:hypothetical protein
MRESLLIVVALSSEMVLRCGLTRRPSTEVRRLQVKATRVADLVVVAQEVHGAAQRRAEEVQGVEREAVAMAAAVSGPGCTRYE